MMTSRRAYLLMTSRRSGQLKPCEVSGCPEVTYAVRCEEHRAPTPDRGRVTGRRWASLRRSVIRDEPLCRLQLEGCTSLAEEVDHVVSIGNGGSPTDRSNLQPVCHSCHVQKTRWDVGQRPFPW